MRAAIYCRVSTLEQVDGTSLGEQERRCSELVESRGWTLAEVYIDEGQSGSKADRPRWRAMLRAAEAGEIDVVVVTKLDRFSRSASHALTQIEALTDLGVQFVSLGESMDLTTAAGRLQLTMLAGVAEFERATIAERGVSGQRAKATQGRWPGGEAPYGFMREGQGKDVRIVPHPQEREVIALAVEALLNHGKTTGEVAATLNALGYKGRRGGTFTHIQVRRLLENESLTGKVAWGKPTRKYGHNTKVNRDGSPKYGPPIEFTLDDPPLDEERWLALQRVLKGRGYGVKSEAKTYPNSQRATVCGGRIGGVWRADRDLRQYRCNNSKWVAGKPPQCECSRINADWLDGQVWGAITDVLATPDRLLGLAAEYLGLREAAAQPEAETIENLEARIARLERSRVETVADYLRAGIAADLVAQAVAKVETEIAAARGYLQQMEAFKVDARAEQERAVALSELARMAADRLPAMSLEQQAEVLRLLRVEVTLLDQTATPTLRIEGTVPGGVDLFSDAETPGYPGQEGPRSWTCWPR